MGGVGLWREMTQWYKAGAATVQLGTGCQSNLPLSTAAGWLTACAPPLPAHRTQLAWTL